jgi:serine/threonine protein kinase
VTRRVLLKADDYLAMIDQYGRLNPITASEFAYHMVNTLTGPAAAMVEANHISNDDNKTKDVAIPCLSSSVVVYEVLGQGAFGAVYGAYDTDMMAEVAVKVLTLVQRDMSKPNMRNEMKDDLLRRELKVIRGMSKIYSKGLIAAFRIEQPAERQHVVVMEKMHSSLKEVLLKSSGTGLDLDICKSYILMLAQGVFDMHRNKWYHRDIKPANVMVSRDQLTVRLGDFGLATGHRHARHYAGSSDYLPPELTDRKKVQGKDLQKADLWSLGVVLYEMATGERLKSTDLSPDGLEDRLRGVAVDKDETSKFVRKWLKKLLRWKADKRELPGIDDYDNGAVAKPGHTDKCEHFPAGVAHGPATPPPGTPNGKIEHLRYKYVVVIVSFV